MAKEAQDKKEQRDPFLVAFGKALASIRNEKGYSSMGLAMKKIGMHRNTLSNIEIGHTNCSLKTLKNICDALEVHPAEVFEKMKEFE